MEIFFLQAECGDAAHIRYKGDDGHIHNVFIDGGFERTYVHVLAERIAGVESIDLFLVSHIHDDHIGGAIAYSRAITRGEVKDKVLRWCYNPPRPKTSIVKTTNITSSAASITHGDVLVTFLCNQNKLPPADILQTSPPLDLYGLKLTWLSPSTKKLNRLRKKYADPAVTLETKEDFSVSKAAGATGNDYYVIIEEFNLKVLMEDDNVENGSSIAFLSELNGFRVLWLADAHPKLLAQSIREMGYTPKNRLICDYVKITHHGSKGNNSDELYELIDCSHYVISADGTNRNYLPSKESLARILRNKQRNIKTDRYWFHFTYDNAVLRSIFDVDGLEVFNKWNFECHFIPVGQKWLQLPDNSAVEKSTHSCS